MQHFLHLLIELFFVFGLNPKLVIFYAAIFNRIEYSSFKVKVGKSLFTSSSDVALLK